MYPSRRNCFSRRAASSLSAMASDRARLKSRSFLRVRGSKALVSGSLSSLFRGLGAPVIIPRTPRGVKRRKRAEEHGSITNLSTPGPTPPDPPLTPDTVAWLAARGWAGAARRPLAGDVSTRRYLRLQSPDAGTALLVLYPTDLRPACHRFGTTTALLQRAGVRVPRVLAVDCDGGRMLVEDLGEETVDVWAARRLDEGAGWQVVAPRFRSAAEAARRITGLPRADVADLSPPLDRELLTRELTLAAEHFLEPRRLLGDRGREPLRVLAAAVAAPPPVPCHRDLMVRNLLPTADGGVAVIDHQDLRLGPPLYDLASLLNDTLFPPAALEEELLAAWGVGAAERTDYHRVAAQRTLKAVGSYAMAAARRNRRRLALVAPTLERALSHLRAVPELAAWAEELARRWEGRPGR